VLIVQRSLDYSLLNTSRCALLLPASREVKYQAKTAIDTFFYRLGDLLSTLSVFVGVRMFDDARVQFIWLIVILSATMTLAAWLVGREYSRRFTAEREPSAGRALAGDASRGVVLQQ
jgi:AAA family ATP:ADP antiporter